jgi:protease IV
MKRRGCWVRSLQVLAILAVLVVLAGGAVAAALAAFGVLGGSVPGTTVLTLDLEPAPVEHAGTDPITQALAGSDEVTVRDIVDALERAGSDDRVEGLLVTLGGASGGMAVAQEIRDAIAAFRDEGKFAIAYAETFGEGAAGNGAYYIAAACDDIYLQPSGDVGLNGLVFETQFLKGTLEKLELQAQMDQRYEYKNAMNTYTEKAFTEAHREALKAVMDSQFDQLVQGIAKGRDLDAAGVRDLIDRGPFLAEDALKDRLVDALLYRDEAREKAKDRAGDKAEFLDLATYLTRAGRPHTKGDTIALIYGVGNVVRGASGFNPLMGEATMGSDTVAAAFRAAIDDDNVKAIIFRIDSPGGSYVASDTIWHEVVRARDEGKPVIATMGNVAGSGGYFVAMAADKIVAQPGSITGSIGVLGGKLVTRDFMAEKLGITTDEVHTSANSRMYLESTPYSPAEWARHEAWLDRVYDDFTSKVADGRDMDIAAVREAAKGRIWTGEAAKELGLVDELGGFPDALRLAKQAADIDSDADVRIRVFPRDKSFLEYLLDRGGDSAQAPVTSALTETARDLQQVARAARDLGLLPQDEDVLSMPYVPAAR